MKVQQPFQVRNRGKFPEIKKVDNANVIASLYGVHPSYVRKLVSGVFFPKKPEAQRKAQAIIEAYHQYDSGKTLLIKAIEKTVKVA